MIIRKPRCVAALAALLACLGSIARAETFTVKLGGSTLGQLSYSGNSSSATLRSTLSNTPFGVFNGTFIGTTGPAKVTDGAQGQAFAGVSRSSRKSREITIDFAKQRVVETHVTPASEETELSDIANVPAGVIDPVRAIGRLITASGCPKEISVYDGRRAIALLPKTSTTQVGMLVCEIVYKVFAGPGHLSPLRISSAKMRVSYELAEDTQRIAQIRIGAGVFKLVLDRLD